MPPILKKDHLFRDIFIALVVTLALILLWGWLGLGAPWNREVMP
jgi:hypothetical protein